jgi:hypothetical protein
MEQSKQNTDIILNGDNTSSWTFREEGELLGTYSGQFIFKCFLTPTEVLSAGRLYRELLGSDSGSATDTEKFLSFALSQLQKRIVKAPPFWTSALDLAGNIPDMDVLSLILDKAISSETLYRAFLKKRRDEALSQSKIATTGLQKRLNANPKPDDEE